MADASHLLCHRCGRALEPGRGELYVVRIEAVADPYPPVIDADEPDPSAEIEDLIRQLDEQSEQELMDQVHRRLTLHLCPPCYEKWIENPTP